MDLQIAGDVAVVVGGARGLGRAIAEAFAAEGASVALVDRDPEGPAVARQIEGEGKARATAFVADVTDFGAMRQVATEVRIQLGGCDHIVHAAAIGSGKFGFPFWNLEPSDWDRVLRVNLVFIASVAGQIGSQSDPPYSASKAGVINFAQCAAKDLAPFGVRVNTLCPGMIQTALNRSVFEAWAARQPESERPSYEEWSAEKIGKLVPLGRWQEPEDIAAMAVFLASPRAKNVTGQTINVDGGYVMHW
jgi:NAD(P)-dependent dehydrogenase (short-subunit alcohol dehydrogenase family)